MINEPSKAQLESARMEMAESSRQSHEENALKPFLNQQQIKQLDQWIKKAERPETEPDRSCATHDRDRVALTSGQLFMGINPACSRQAFDRQK